MSANDETTGETEYSARQGHTDGTHDALSDFTPQGTPSDALSPWQMLRMTVSYHTDSGAFSDEYVLAYVKAYVSVASSARGTYAYRGA
jgi:hypothetical protein